MAEIAYQFDPDLVLREMDYVKAWLTRAGLEPKHVPINARVVFNDDNTMTVDVYLLNADGSKYVIEDAVAKGTATVPLLWPPPFKSLIGIPAVPAGESAPEVTE